MRKITALPAVLAFIVLFGNLLVSPASAVELLQDKYTVRYACVIAEKLPGNTQQLEDEFAQLLNGAPFEIPTNEKDLVAKLKSASKGHSFTVRAIGSVLCTQGITAEGKPLAQGSMRISLDPKDPYQIIIRDKYTFTINDRGKLQLNFEGNWAYRGEAQPGGWTAYMAPGSVDSPGWNMWNPDVKLGTTSLTGGVLQLSDTKRLLYMTCAIPGDAREKPAKEPNPAK